MSDIQTIRELEAQFASEEEKLKELQQRDEELLQHIPEKGFHVASDHVHLQNQMDVLYESIREKNMISRWQESSSQRRLGKTVERRCPPRSMDNCHRRAPK